MILGLGLSGIPFAGSDIGGFVGAPSAELYSRWLQSAVLVPFARTHAMIGTPRREPWSYGPTYERANRASIRLRYRMMPALYTAYYQHTKQGSPVARPIFWNALGDTSALGTDNEFLLGDHILVAPVLDSGAQNRAVYLPAGHWYRFGSGEQYEGGRANTVAAPGALNDGGDTTGLAGLPVFVRAGAVVPTQAVVSYEGQRKLDTMEVHVYPGSATSQLYEDAGDGYGYQRGEYRLTSFQTSTTAHQLVASLAREGSYPGVHTFEVIVHDVDRPRRTLVDGRAARTEYKPARRELRFVAPSTVRRIELDR